MTELQQKYLEISKDITLVLEDMKSNWDRYPDYLGWFDLNSPIVEHPDILFIGINQGPERYLQWNWDNWDNKRKMHIDSEKKKSPNDFLTLWRSRLQWLIPNNARENGGTKTREKRISFHIICVNSLSEFTEENTLMKAERI